MIARGNSLGHYLILRRLGSGGMADVYEAEDQNLGRRIALKVLPPELGRNPEFIKRFESEVRAAASLDHPGIVTVFEVGQADGCMFYSMRLLPGGDLSDRIRGGMTVAQSLAMVRELADAFDHAHTRGFVHRDVKPSNILFDERGRAVLTDFGIVKALNSDSNLTATGVAIGTPRYMCPEQARGHPVDARSDLYSLGVILYEMLTGRVPFDAPESVSVIYMHVAEPVPRLQGVQAILQPLLDSLMAKSPADRPASAAALIAIVDALDISQVANARPGLQRDTATAQTPIPSPIPSPGPVAVTAEVRGPEAGSTPVASRRIWLWVAFSGAGLLAALVLALQWPITKSEPASATLRLPVPEPVAHATPSRTPVAVPQPAATTPRTEADDTETVTATVAPAPTSEVPASETDAIPAPADASIPSRKESTARASPQQRGGGPECEELYTLFGLGQTLNDAQRAFLAEKC